MERKYLSLILLLVFLFISLFGYIHFSSNIARENSEVLSSVDSAPYLENEEWKDIVFRNKTKQVVERYS